MPLSDHRPPEILRRPVNVKGSPSYEIWTLASLDDWSASHLVAIYSFSGYTHRDLSTRPNFASDLVLPWAASRPTT